MAISLFVALAICVCGPAIVGRSALGPDRTLDADSLYGALPEDVVLVHNDASPVVLDLPRDLVFARGLHAGRIDAWNPHVACGAPLWAEQGGPFFPLKLPFYLKPSRATHHLFLALRLLLAALGAFALARRMGRSYEAALVVGALFELSGALFAHLAFAVASAVFMMPWVLLAAQLVADAGDLRSRTRATVAAAIVLGITGHGGHPTLVAMAFSAFALVSLGHAISLVARRRVAGRDSQRALAVLVHAAFAGALGLALAAPALLPLAELASVGRSYKDTNSGDRIWQGDLSRFRATTPIALFAPHLLTTMRARLDILFPYLFAPTIGVLGLLLGLTGIALRGVGLPLLLPLMMGVALAISPPGLGWVHKLPVMRLIMPQYPWVLVQLPLVLAAGAAVDELARGTSRSRRALLGAALLMVAGAGLIAVIERDPYAQYDLHLILRDALIGVAGKARLVVPLVVVVAIGVVGLVWRRGPYGAGAGAGAGAGERVAREWPWQRRTALGLGALAVLELGAIIVPKTRMPVSHALERPPSAAVRYLSEKLDETSSRMHAIPYKVGFPNTPMVWGLDDFREVSALPVRRFIDYLSAIGPPVGFTVQTVDRSRSPLLDVAAVRWIVVRRVKADPEPLLGREPQLPLRWHDEHVAIYENTGAVPRYRITHEMRIAKTREVALFFAWGLSGTDPVARLDAPVAIEADSHGRFPTALPGGRLGAEEMVRRIDRAGPGKFDDPDRLVLEARLDRDGLVVVADTWYPGWKATIDGTPTEIYPADELFRAVRVPAGTHTIEMRYQPRSLRLGLALMAVALGACLLLVRGSRLARGPVPLV